MIVVTNTFDKVKIAVTEYQKSINDLKKQLRTDFIETLKVDCTELKDQFPALDYIFILGSTPKWNDGEECTHDSDVFVDNTEGSYWNNIPEYLERLYYGEEDDYPDEYKNSNKGLSSEDVQKIKNTLSASKLEDGLEIIYETDFNIIIDFTGETVTVTVKDYDCGH